MKCIYFNGENYEYRTDYPMPVRTKDHSLIRILMAALCNTDREILKGYRPDFKGVMGHEFVGIVEDSDCRELIGKRVVGELNEGCGHCIYCKSGREKHCPERKVIGMEKLDGCFAEYMVLADHLIHIVPDTLETKTAIFTEPLAAALEIPKQVHIEPDTSICLIGDGRLSFMIAQVIRLTGANLTILGKHSDKLKEFEKSGKTMLTEKALEMVQKDPEKTWEIVIDATGSEKGLEAAAKLVRKKGTIILKSTYAGKSMVDMSYFVVNEITITGSRCGPFEPALNLLQKGLVELPNISLFPMEKFDQMLEAKAFKAGIDIYNIE